MACNVAEMVHGRARWEGRLKLAICVATMRPRGDGLPGEITTWTTHIQSNGGTWRIVRVRQWDNSKDNIGVVAAYQKLYEESDEDVLLYLHDDVTCREQGWDEKVIHEFEDPQVAVLGFGGALYHGHPDIYKTPYKLQQLGRSFYRSNVDDAEVHGERFTGACDVAVLDGFALAVRRSLLDRCGGWSRFQLDFFGYDYSICAMAHRHGFRVRLVGIRCHHHGGGTSVAGKAGQITSPEAYEKAHRWFYNEFRDVMPWSCLNGR